MTGRNQLYFMLLDLFQILLDDLAEGHHDLRIVSLGRLVNARLIGNV